MAAAVGDVPALVQELNAAGAGQGGVTVAILPASGDTLLHVAAAHGQSRVARELLRRGADSSARNQLGQTPSTLAKLAGAPALAELLEGEETQAGAGGGAAGGGITGGAAADAACRLVEMAEAEQRLRALSSDLQASLGVDEMNRMRAEVLRGEGGGKGRQLDERLLARRREPEHVMRERIAAAGGIALPAPSGRGVWDPPRALKERESELARQERAQLTQPDSLDPRKLAGPDQGGSGKIDADDSNHNLSPSPTPTPTPTPMPTTVRAQSSTTLRSHLAPQSVSSRGAGSLEDSEPPAHAASGVALVKKDAQEDEWEEWKPRLRRAAGKPGALHWGGELGKGDHEEEERAVYARLQEMTGASSGPDSMAARSQVDGAAAFRGKGVANPVEVWSTAPLWLQGGRLTDDSDAFLSADLPPDTGASAPITESPSTILEACAHAREGTRTNVSQAGSGVDGHGVDGGGAGGDDGVAVERQIAGQSPLATQSSGPREGMTDGQALVLAVVEAAPVSAPQVVEAEGGVGEGVDRPPGGGDKLLEAVAKGTTDKKKRSWWLPWSRAKEPGTAASGQIILDGSGDTPGGGDADGAEEGQGGEAGGSDHQGAAAAGREVRLGLPVAATAGDKFPFLRSTDIASRSENVSVRTRRR